MDEQLSHSSLLPGINKERHDNQRIGDNANEDPQKVKFHGAR
jgi:hypothetical protein